MDPNESYGDQLDDTFSAWVQFQSKLPYYGRIDTTCVHCHLLPEGLSHHHNVFGVCKPGKPQEVWFRLNRVLLEMGALPPLADWTVHQVDRGSLIRLDCAKLDHPYVWLVKLETDPDPRPGWVFGQWVD